MRRVYRLPEKLRSTLAKPLGRLYSEAELESSGFKDIVDGSPMVVTVGDRVTETVWWAGRLPDVQVIDSRERRRDRELPAVPYVRLVNVKNPAGTLTSEAINGIREAFEGKKPVRVLVDGEEDLLAIPVIALCPLSATVFYGQPGEEVVAVKVSADTKSRNRTILAEIGISELR